MTADTHRPNVLLIGKSQAVLDGAVAGLRELGYTAQDTNDFGPVTGRFDLPRVDLVVFGGAVPADRKAELTQEISAVNPAVIVVQGLVGIPGLIVKQVQAEFAPTDAPGSAGYRAGERAIQLTLAQAANVRVTAFWQSSFVPPDPKSESLVLLDGPLAAGEHLVALPDVVPDHAAFAAVEIGEAIYTFPVATR